VRVVQPSMEAHAMYDGFYKAYCAVHDAILPITQATAAAAASTPR
jgi:hypothetical protein